jgi:hypothetical protein
MTAPNNPDSPLWAAMPFHAIDKLLKEYPNNSPVHLKLLAVY